VPSFFLREIFFYLIKNTPFYNHIPNEETRMTKNRYPLILRQVLKDHFSHSTQREIMPTPRARLSCGFDTTFLQLPEKFYQLCSPAPVTAPELRLFNHELAKKLELPFHTEDPELTACLAGNLLFADSQPLAMAYAGHQFGSFVPQLGDGRAILLGEKVTADGQRFDIQLKGSGITRFSRNGDGRSALGPVLREYIVSEAMHALGVPTTRSLAVLTSGEKVVRSEGTLPGAILVRVASGLVRTGTFEYFSARNDEEAVRQLAEYVIARHYPESAENEKPFHHLFASIASAGARLTAQWMALGFIHGVMNTDNIAVSGETIDYGPCAFMDNYHPNRVFSSIDFSGRYRYSAQGSVMNWNLSRLGSCLLPLFGQDGEEFIEAITGSFEQEFLQVLTKAMLRKIGIEAPREDDSSLLQELLALMQKEETDFTLTFRHLAECIDGDTKPFSTLFHNNTELPVWLDRWQKRMKAAEEPATTRQRMKAVNPLFIPRNHRIEQAINAAQQHDDFAPARKLIQVLQTPFTEQPEFAEFANAPKVEERVLQTFCGT
jgi:uncharacterized protein YdiU (UPF0061 family)